jgi:hypothetical protein
VEAAVVAPKPPKSALSLFPWLVDDHITNKMRRA